MKKVGLTLILPAALAIVLGLFLTGTFAQHDSAPTESTLTDVSPGEVEFTAVDVPIPIDASGAFSVMVVTSGDTMHAALANDRTSSATATNMAIPPDNVLAITSSSLTGANAYSAYGSSIASCSTVFKDCDGGNAFTVLDRQLADALAYALALPVPIIASATDGDLTTAAASGICFDSTCATTTTATATGFPGYGGSGSALAVTATVTGNVDYNANATATASGALADPITGVEFVTNLGDAPGTGTMAAASTGGTTCYEGTTICGADAFATLTIATGDSTSTTITIGGTSCYGDGSPCSASATADTSTIGTGDVATVTAIGGSVCDSGSTACQASAMTTITAGADDTAMVYGTNLGGVFSTPQVGAQAITSGDATATATANVFLITSEDTSYAIADDTVNNATATATAFSNTDEVASLASANDTVAIDSNALVTTIGAAANSGSPDNVVAAANVDTPTGIGSMPTDRTITSGALGITDALAAIQSDHGSQLNLIS